MEVNTTVVSKDEIKNKAAFRAYCQKNDRCFNCEEKGHKQPSYTKPKASIASTKTKKQKYEYDSDLKNEYVMARSLDRGKKGGKISIFPRWSRTAVLSMYIDNYI